MTGTIPPQKARAPADDNIACRGLAPQNHTVPTLYVPRSSMGCTRAQQQNRTFDRDVPDERTKQTTLTWDTETESHESRFTEPPTPRRPKALMAPREQLPPADCMAKHFRTALLRAEATFSSPYLSPVSRQKNAFKKRRPYFSHSPSQTCAGVPALVCGREGPSSPPASFPLRRRQYTMATELNPDGWDGGEPVVEPVVADGWGENEADAPLAVEESAISDVQLFNKW